MRCRRAHRAITDRRIGRLPAFAERELLAHLGSCESCAAEAADEVALFEDLTALRREPAPTVDVRARVLQGIAELPDERRREVSRGQLGWAGLAAAAAMGIVVVAVAIGLPPLIPQAVREARWLAGGLGALASVVNPPVEALLAAAGSLGGLTLDLLGALSVIFDKLAIVPQAMMAFSLAVMTAVATFVVARDLGLLPTPAPRKELGT